MARKRRSLGDTALPRSAHAHRLDMQIRLAGRAAKLRDYSQLSRHLRVAQKQVNEILWHDRSGVDGLGDGCRDSRGNFVPVPACMGRHVPRAAKRGAKKQCKHGVNKRTGKCLKHPRRK